jgi:hypothetical protein
MDTLAVAEQLGFEQVLRQSGAVYLQICAKKKPLRLEAHKGFV